MPTLLVASGFDARMSIPRVFRRVSDATYPRRDNSAATKYSPESPVWIVDSFLVIAPTPSLAVELLLLLPPCGIISCWGALYRTCAIRAYVPQTCTAAFPKHVLSEVEGSRSLPHHPAKYAGQANPSSTWRGEQSPWLLKEGRQSPRPASLDAGRRQVERVRACHSRFTCHLDLS